MYTYTCTVLRKLSLDNEIVFCFQINVRMLYFRLPPKYWKTGKTMDLILQWIFSVVAFARFFALIVGFETWSSVRLRSILVASASLVLPCLVTRSTSFDGLLMGKVDAYFKSPVIVSLPLGVFLSNTSHSCIAADVHTNLWSFLGCYLDYTRNDVGLESDRIVES